MKRKLTQKEVTKIFNKIQQEYDYESLIILASTGKFEGFGMISGTKERTFDRMIKFLQKFYHEASLEKLTAEEMNVEEEMWDGVKDFVKILDKFTISKNSEKSNKIFPAHLKVLEDFVEVDDEGNISIAITSDALLSTESMKKLQKEINRRR